MKKVLIITNHSYMLYQFRHELIERLLKDHEVVLSMPYTGCENNFMDMGCKCIETMVDRRGINPKTDFKLLKVYYKMLKSEKPDLVITYSIKPNIYAGLVCCVRKTPYCANVQGLGTAFQKKWLAAFVTMLYKLAFRKVNTVFFENQGNAQEFIDRSIVSKDKITVLNGAGVNLEHYSFKEYPDNGGITHFLYLGRIMKEKGIDELFAAIKNLRKKYGEKVVLDLVGFFEDEYKEQVEDLQAGGAVVFHGFQTEPRPYYEMADCVILPSYHEGMSNVLLEAAASGRPIITSNIHGCKEAVDDGISGLLCNVKDSDDLERKMDEFINLTIEEKKTFGKNGRSKMEKEFDKRMVVRNTIDKLFIDK